MVRQAMLRWFSALLLFIGCHNQIHAAMSGRVLVRGRANERMWQTDFLPDMPLEWRWGKSELAEITVTNYASGAVTESVVLKSGNEVLGELSLPSAKDSSGRVTDAVFDVGIVLKKDGVAVDSLFARIARVTGAGYNANPTVVRNVKSQWGFVKSASAVVPYDAAWHVKANSSAVMFNSDPVVSGRSGYVPLPMPGGTDGNVSLSFDGELYSQARLVRVVSGMFLILR